MDNKSKDNIENEEEKPKAVQEMEEKKLEEDKKLEEAKTKEKELKEGNDKKETNIKSSNKKFIIKYVIFVIILVAITVVGLYYTLQYLNKPTEEATITEEVATKPKAEDSKYAINSYAETYDENSIDIKFYDENGQSIIDPWIAQYIQIDGLLDKSIQENINKRLKQTAQDLKSYKKPVYSRVKANFGNILSVLIYSENKRSYLNIDLSTGEDILFEKVFVSSAPLNSLITEGVFRSLAWDNSSYDFEETDGLYDMDKIDTSDYEDKSLMVINNYKKNKENIKYYITPSSVYVEGLIDSNISDSYYEGETIEIDFIDHKEDIAIYKRYLTNTSIFESDSLGAKDIVVFTEGNSSRTGIENILYGKIEDNIFMEEVVNGFNYGEISEDKQAQENIKKYLNKLANEDKQKIKSETSNNTGVFYQKEYDVSKSVEGEYYWVSVNAYKATCEIEYFKNEAFKDYAKMKNGPRADDGLNGFMEFQKDEYPNLKISYINEYTYIYLDKDGNFLGDTEEEAKAKTSSGDSNTSATENNQNTNDNSNLNNTNANYLNSTSTNTIEDETNEGRDEAETNYENEIYIEDEDL